MSETHDFDNTVVAILDEEPSVRDAVESLYAAGYEPEILRGREGRNHIDPSTGDGLTATIKSLLTTFGDQKRIIETLDQAMSEGKTVLSVDLGEEGDAGAVIPILQDHGGRYIWRLGEWTFTPIES